MSIPTPNLRSCMFNAKFVQNYFIHAAIMINPSTAIIPNYPDSSTRIIDAAVLVAGIIDVVLVNHVQMNSK